MPNVAHSEYFETYALRKNQVRRRHRTLFRGQSPNGCGTPSVMTQMVSLQQYPKVLVHLDHLISALIPISRYHFP